MKKGQTYIGKVSEVRFPNRGIVTCEDGEAMVKNVIPGQTVEFVAGRKKSGMCEGRLLSIIEQSILEDSSNCCPHFGVCGGCSYQSMSYANQLELKKTQVLKLLQSVADTFEFEGIIGSPAEQGYRNKMEFSFGDECMGGELALGMHRRGSFYDIVNVSQCHIVDSDFRMILSATLDFFSNEGLPFYHKMKHTGFLRHLLVRKGIKTGELMVDIVTTTQHDYDFKRYTDMLCALPLAGSLVSVLHTENDSLSDVVCNDRTYVLHGRDYIYEELLELRFKITPFSFFQTNTLGAEVLYAKVAEYAGNCDNKVIFDLYSGTGTIAQILAARATGTRVVGVEIVPEAVEAAVLNASLNKIGNCDFICGDVLKVVGELTDKPDFIILDPPRDGIHPKAIGRIIDFGVENIVYVSCKPTSLARDLEILQAHGYVAKKVCCVDMFPATANVETVCLLSKLHEAKHHVNVKLDMD